MYYYLAAASKRLLVDMRDWCHRAREAVLVGEGEGVGGSRCGDRYNSKGLQWQTRSGKFTGFYSRIVQDPMPASESSTSSVATASRAASLSRTIRVNPRENFL